MSEHVPEPSEEGELHDEGAGPADDDEKEIGGEG